MVRRLRRPARGRSARPRSLSVGDGLALRIARRPSDGRRRVLGCHGQQRWSVLRLLWPPVPPSHRGPAESPS
eukprot:652851-Alexandrium_andersonii.AAC.1